MPWSLVLDVARKASSMRRPVNESESVFIHLVRTYLTELSLVRVI